MSPASSIGAATASRPAHLLGLTLLLVAVGAAFWPTLASMVAIWVRSETFAHGFLVVPVSAFLIWRRRSALRATRFRTAPLALPFVALAGLAWLLADLADVLVLEQLAIVALVVTATWLMLGSAAMRLLAFPLVFLVFAVPMGEGLIEPLMEFTAVFTVSLLRLTGIPVFWDGTFFSIPTGDWSVVEACSGLRYLIASLFLGVLYAYLNYRALWRRLLFIALAAVVPVIANGLRAYAIVMIGHLSGMKLAVGVDHLIYGWVFFGVVMFLLFAVGNLWSDRRLNVTEEDFIATDGEDGDAAVAGPARRIQVVFVLGALVILAWPALDAYLGLAASSVAPSRVIPPAGRAGWALRDSHLTGWEPRYVDPALEIRREFERDSKVVGLYIAVYGGGRGELINSQNVMIPQKDPDWRMPHQRPTSVYLDGRDITVIEAPLQSSGQELLTWHWFWIDGHHVANDYLAKLYEVLAVLTGNAFRQAGVVLYTEVGLKMEDARDRLELFVREMMPGIEASLEGMRLAETDRAGSSSIRAE